MVTSKEEATSSISGLAQGSRGMHVHETNIIPMLYRQTPFAMRLPYRSTPLLIALQLAGIGCVQSAANLTFMFITSFGQFGLNTSGVVPAADMAIRDINSRSGLLPGYSLMYDSVKDSQVSVCIERWCMFDTYNM